MLSPSLRQPIGANLPPMATDLAPGFLVAAPSLLDPNFSESVVLLVDHRPEGSLGFVVNRPAHIGFDMVVDELGLEHPEPGPPSVPVLVGGPVSPNTGWIVFSGAEEGPGADVIEVTSTIRVSASREQLEQLALQEQVERHLLVLGYAGRGAGQLDEEIKQGAWIPVELDEAVIFDAPFSDRWSAALTAAGIDPRMLVGTSSESGAN